MIFLNIYGGLGNQMFQLAFALALNDKHNHSIYLETSAVSGKDQASVGHIPRQFELGIFNVEYKLITKGLLKRNIYRGDQWIWRTVKGYKKFNLIKEFEFGFHPVFLNTSLPVLLDGYFQSEKYFIDYEAAIRSAFKFPVIESEKYGSTYLNEIKRSDSSVAVHFRRGDLVSDPQFFANHGICSPDYYRKAFEYFSSKLSDPVFYIFSDEISIIRDEIKDLPYRFVFVEHSPEVPNWIDMMLMSECKHHIIANSSFSWWGAWLSANPNKQVIAPKKWFASHKYSDKDVVPESWLRM